MATVKTTAKRLESLGKVEFARLFERLFPNGLDTNGFVRFSYMNPIRERADSVLVRRGYNAGDLLCQCSLCSKHFEIHMSILSDRLYRQVPLECAAYGCSGSMLPIYREQKKEDEQ